MSGKSKHLGELTYRQMEILRLMSAGESLRTSVESPLQLSVGMKFEEVITNHVVRQALEREGLIFERKDGYAWRTWLIIDAGRERVKAWDKRLEQHWRAKFTDDQVRKIRQRYERWQKIKAEKQVTIEGLAEEFNVSASCIGTMLAGDTYKGVK